MARLQPGHDEVTRVLAEQNPWHASGRIPEALAPPIERQLAHDLWALIHDPAATRRAHLILGPRRVGKTTVMYQTARRLLDSGVEPDRLWWLRLDHPFLMGEPLGDLMRRVISESRAARGAEAIVFLDELVYAPDWDLWLKTFHDDRWPVLVIATSSATAALRDRHRESGVGRWDEHFLPPYQFVEYLSMIDAVPAIEPGPTLATTIDNLPRHVPQMSALAAARRRFALIGGFPELLAQDVAHPEAAESDRLLQSQQRLRGEAVERAIYKDIPQSFGIDNPMLLERLLYVLAGQVTGILSPSSISGDLDGLSQPTLDRYISYLEQTFLVFRTMNWSGTEGIVQHRGRKLYFLDGAVRNAALQRGLAPLTDPVEMGLLLENLVGSSLHDLALQSGHRLYYWRGTGRRGADGEVDFVLDHPDGPLAFEVGSSPRHHREGLRRIAQRYPALAGRTYLVSPDAPLRQADAQGGHPGALPLDVFLVAIGLQAQAAATARLRA